MRIGKLRHRIEIQTNTPTDDTFGEPIASWATDATVWASIEPLAGRELLRAQEIASEVTTRIRVRYTTDATPAKRIKWGTRYYEIAAVIDPSERHAEMELLCVEVV